MNSTSAVAEESVALRRSTGLLLTIGALSFGIAATILSITSDWPDILLEDADVVLPGFSGGGTTLIGGSSSSRRLPAPTSRATS